MDIVLVIAGLGGGVIILLIWHTEQFSGPCDVLGATAVGEQPVMADAMEAARQDMGQEAADKLASVESVMTFCRSRPLVR